LGILDFFRTKKEKRSFDPQSGLNLFRNTKSGVRVSEQNSIGLTAVWASVRLLSETVAAMPLNVYKREKDGDRFLEEKHPLNTIVSVAPYSHYTSYTWKQTFMNHLLLWGNAYCKINRNGGAKVDGLELLDPQDVKVEKNEDTGEIIYICKSGNYYPEEILHFVGFSFDGLIGKSPIKACREALGLGMAAQTFGENFFGKGANLSGVLSHPGRLTEDAANRLRGSWNDRFSGIHNSHQTAILEEGVEFKPIGMPLDDAQFIETRRFSVEEVARIFRVPPHLIGDLTRSTYSNIEQQSLEFTKYSLQPYLVNIEQELNKKLLPEKDRGKYYLKFKTSELLRGDVNSRSDYYRKMFEIGALSPNEIRGFEDLNKIENGDEHYVPLNLGNVGQEKINENEKIEEPKKGFEGNPGNEEQLEEGDESGN